MDFPFHGGKLRVGELGELGMFFPFATSGRQGGMCANHDNSPSAPNPTA